VAPELFSFEPARLRVLTDGERLGRLERIEGEPNAELCVGVDAAAVEALLLARLFCAPVLSPA
jgi:purine nucleosidase